MRLFAKIDGLTNTRFDRAAYLTPPFDLQIAGSPSTVGPAVRRSASEVGDVIRRPASAASDVIRRSASGTTSTLKRG